MNRRVLILTLLWLAALAQPALASDTVYYYYTDALHSTVVQADAQGNIVEQSTHYAPYGQVLNRPMRDGPGYTSHEEDPSTGLNYMQQRYFDPQSGRFLSTDPVLPTDDGGNFNRYWYANDNPYRYTDPDGRIAGVDDAAGFILGAIINIAITVAHDEATSQTITRGEIIGAAVSGGIEGIGLVNAPESGGLTAAMAYGGGAEAAGNAIQQIFDKQASAFSVKDVLESGLAGATIGGITHGIPDARIPGLSSGRNSMNAIGKALRTKIADGNASGMSMKTAMKTAVGSQAADLGRKTIGTSIANNPSHPLTVTITCPASAKPAQPCG